MNSKNLIDRAAKNMVDGIKDAVDANIIASVRSKQIDVKQEHLPLLVALVKSSIDEGYIRSSRVFEKTVDSALAQHVASLAPPTKKKPA